MLTHDYSKLDRKYIIVKSKYLLDEGNQNYLKSIRELARGGQINALQDFFANVKEYDMIDPEILNHIVALNSKFRHNFEENYLLALYAESKGLTSATLRYSDTCKQIYQNLFAKDRSPVAFVRYAEICEEIKETELKTVAVELAREGFRKSVIEKNISGNEKLPYMYAQLVFMFKYGKNKNNARKRLEKLVEELSSSESV